MVPLEEMTSTLLHVSDESVWSYQSRVVTDIMRSCFNRLQWSTGKICSMLERLSTRRRVDTVNKCTVWLNVSSKQTRTLETVFFINTTLSSRPWNLNIYSSYNKVHPWHINSGIQLFSTGLISLSYLTPIFLVCLRYLVIGTETSYIGVKKDLLNWKRY